MFQESVIHLVSICVLLFLISVGYNNMKVGIRGYEEKLWRAGGFNTVGLLVHLKCLGDRFIYGFPVYARSQVYLRIHLTGDLSWEKHV